MCELNNSMLTLTFVLFVYNRLYELKSIFTRDNKKVHNKAKMIFSITSANAVENKNKSDDKTPVWKQLLLSLLISLPFFTHGVETTALSASAHSGHFVMTPKTVPWSTTALFLASIVAAPFYWYLLDKWGRRSGVYVVSLSQGASCIPLFLPETEASGIALHVLAGISTAGLFIVLPTYIREINNDSLRGFSLSHMMPLTTLGYLMYLVLDLEAMMFLMVALVAAQFLGMLVMVESPSYLVMAGKIESAKTSIAKLKNTSESDPVVARQLDVLVKESEKARSKGRLTLWRILKNPIYRDIIKIGVIINTTLVVCGSIVFLDQEKALMQLKIAIATEKALVLGCLFVGGIFTWATIYFLDRKTLLSIGFSIMVISMGLLGVFTQQDLTVTSVRWLPVLALAILVFGYGMVWGLRTIIMTEMLNFEIRGTILTTLFMYTQAIRLAHIHTFPYIEEYMGLYTIFYVFAIVNMFGGVYTLFRLPTIRNKSLREIEKQMKRIPLIKFNTVIKVENGR